MLATALIAAAAISGPPAAPALGCENRITGAFIEHADGRRIVERFDIDRRRDRIFGPLAFSGLRSYARQRNWDWMVERDQWMKSIAIVKPGARVTLEVPRSQRSWMRLVYGGGGPTVTLKGCREKSSGPSGNTAFSGGFEIDYAEAPHQGRCARLRVWVQGRERPLRKRLFVPRGRACP